MNEKWKINKALGKRPIVIWADKIKLKVDDDYQRSTSAPVSHKLIKDIACNWNWDLVSVLTVSNRGADGLFVVDGQHRLSAAKHRADIDQLPCIILDCPNQKEEASLFVSLNGKRRKPTPLDQFHAELVTGDATANDINSIVEECGLIIGRDPYYSHQGQVTCIPTLKRCYRKYGRDTLSLAMHTITKSFPDAVYHQSERNIFDGICKLFDESKDKINISRLIKSLSSHQNIRNIFLLSSSMASNPYLWEVDKPFFIKLFAEKAYHLSLEAA